MFGCKVVLSASPNVAGQCRQTALVMWTVVELGTLIQGRPEKSAESNPNCHSRGTLRSQMMYQADDPVTT